jgi:hypothetical protein
MKRLLLLAALVCAGCTDKDGAADALRKAGYTAIETGGYSWFGCGKGDDYATKFKAKGPTGVPVSGVVCAGVLGKGKTIRLD